ncbi:Protein transport protein Sec31A [Hordeum vulgare]|nr:Protein transport protein Sec31A [Hordeum vulgare]
MKMEWDRAGGGAQVIIGVEGVEDLIPTNRWLKRAVVPKRVEYMSMLLGAGRRPRTGHEEGTQEPIRFYVHIHDQEDITMLVTPRAFKPVMKQWLVIGPPCIVSLSANKWV